MDKKSIQNVKANWDDEMNTTLLYCSLAEMEKDARLAEVYKRLAAVEKHHADKWADVLKEEGIVLPEFSPSWQTKTLIWLSRRIGPEVALTNLQRKEVEGTRSYTKQGGDARNMAAEENSHAKIISQITGGIRGGIQGGALAMLEGRHRSTGGNALRAAVLGANDGLVSNLSLVMGVAGANLSGHSILITGFAGLLAGACSMALGEWLSVQSSRELYENQIRIEKEEILTSPEEEAEELALIYEARGLDKNQAQILSTQIMSSPKSAIDTLAREELGINPEELGGSAWEAAITSFILFAGGAIIPVIPFLLFSGFTAVVASIGLSTIGLFLIGSMITLFTGKGVFQSGFRMVAFGLLAAAITFGIGKLIGVSVGG